MFKVLHSSGVDEFLFGCIPNLLITLTNSYTTDRYVNTHSVQMSNVKADITCAQLQVVSDLYDY